MSASLSDLLLLQQLLSAKQNQKLSEQSSPESCPHHLHAPGALDHDSQSSSSASNLSFTQQQKQKTSQSSRNQVKNAKPAPPVEPFFRLPLAPEKLECCKCHVEFALPAVNWSAIDTSVFVIVNGGFRWPISALDADARRSAPAILRKLVESFLTPIANRAWPASWTQHGFPRIKWKDAPFVRKLGAPSAGSFVLLRAAGFQINAEDDVWLEMPDAATDSRVAHVAASIARVLELTVQLETVLLNEGLVELIDVSPLQTPYEMYRSLFAYRDDLAKTIDPYAAITVAEYTRGTKIKDAVFALLFFCRVMNGEEPIALVPSAEEAKKAAQFLNNTKILVGEIYETLGIYVATEERKKNPPKPAQKVLTPASAATAPVKRARTGDSTLSEEQQMELAIAESLEANNSNAMLGNAELGESDELVFASDGKPKGLTNTRQSCHANSLIQALFALKPLRRELLLAHRALSERASPTDRKQLGAVECLRELTLLFARLDLTSARAVSARRFMERLMRESALLPGLQHDVTEVKDLMLSTLEIAIPSLKETFYGTQYRLHNQGDPNAAELEAIALLAWPPANDGDLNDENVSAESSVSGDDVTEVVVDVQAAVAEKITFSDVIVHLRRDLCSDDLDEALARSLLGDLAFKPQARLNKAILAPPPLLTVSVQRVEYDSTTRRAEKIDTMMRFRRTLSLQRYANPEVAPGDNTVVIDRKLSRLRRRLAHIERTLNSLQGGSKPLLGALDTVSAFLGANKEMSAGLLPPSLPSNFGEQLSQFHAHVAQQIEALNARAQEICVRIDMLMNERDGDEPYALHAVLVHQGAPETGHYFAFVRANFDDEDSWYKCNDSQVDRVNWQQVCESSIGGARGKGSAYCLIYASAEYRARTLSLNDENVLDLYDAATVAAVSKRNLFDSSVF